MMSIVVVVVVVEIVVVVVVVVVVIDRGPRTLPSIAGHARCHRSHEASTHGRRTHDTRTESIAEPRIRYYLDSPPRIAHYHYYY